MAGSSSTYPWSGWPPDAQQRLFRFVLTGLGGLFFAVFVGVFLFTSTLTQEIEAEKAQYGLVVPIVQNITRLRANQGDLVHLAPGEAVQRIIEDRKLEDYVASMRTTRLREEADSVQVTLNGLTLIMLTDFLQDVRERASLQTPDFTLTRNPDDPRLADMHLVLAR
ncbi:MULTISPECIES: hypothetical protein [unclassified Pseudodesulfovibrio]|uniref:hypothetical protein n=1 Tax=unclassified Pseudodesulfovibrio TaxID=2661612 RepID=UPI000FEB5FD5|nr:MULTISPECIES: hypothetical protein [unclassified Pseudodesulfovibrio]MCJ2165111.1 hypothetical protein [Pseudodesulfovibrio sp. S3-i]RWU03426.1 hypothetical protein DWB63_11480 [Pseudodesulfovibrio sp. S3]